MELGLFKQLIIVCLFAFQINANSQIISGFNVFGPSINIDTNTYIIKPQTPVDTALRTAILALPGIAQYWPLTNSYSSGKNLASSDTATLGGHIQNDVNFPGANQAVNFFNENNSVIIPNTAFSAFNWSSGWLMIWIKTDSVCFQNQGTNTINLINAAPQFAYAEKNQYSISYGRHTFGLNNPPNNSVFEFSKNSNTWDFLVMNWGGSIMRLYYNGAKLYSGNFGAIPGGVIANQIGKINGWRGAVAHYAFGEGSALTDNQVGGIFNIVYPHNKNIFACGDSKAAGSDDRWIPLTVGATIQVSDSVMWREAPYRIGKPGGTVSNIDPIFPFLAARIDTAEYSPKIILVSGGTNDIYYVRSGIVDSVSFCSGMVQILDTLHGKFPGANIFWIRPYIDPQFNGTYNSYSLTVSSWIDSVLGRAEYSAFSHPGTNENVWFRANIRTYSDDGVHYNNAGNMEAANQWKTILQPYSN